MENLTNLMFGFSVALEPTNLFYCFIGVLVGTLVGVLPGLGPSATIALLLPVTFNIKPVSALIMLCGIMYGSQYGGSTTAILLNIPGEASSIATCLDGYQMARKGRAGAALGISAFGSFIAGTLTLFGLIIFAPALANFGLRFGPPEFFSLMLLGLSIVTYLARGSMIKALMMAALGLMLGCVGMDLIVGKPRFTFRLLNLADGIGIVPMTMGLFGVAEVLENVGDITSRSFLSKKVKGILPSKQDWKRSIGPIGRGAFLGFFMGIIPGTGATIPTFISYVVEKRISKHPERFGTGEIEGVAGPESCNNAAASGNFIPTLSLGIPASPSTAILLGALMIYGLQPGPLLIKTRPELFWGLVASMYLGNGLLLVLNLPLIPVWVRILRVPYTYLFAVILLTCLIGAYSLNNNIFDLWIIIIFGVVGYLLKLFGNELAPLVLAFILGPTVEVSLRRSLIMSDGSLTIFLTRPISAIFLLITLVVLLLPLVMRRRLGAGLSREE
ncbi:MAG: tripartite tricarboxylate transporter permease [Deltaproteobacteria bacterium]